MRVLITGGAGFIGSNLARHLSDNPDLFDLAILDDFSGGYVENLGGIEAEVIEGSILDAALLQDAVSGCDAIVHLAARPSVPRSLRDPGKTHSVNATGTLNVLESARGVGAHVILASSSSVYGASPELPKSEGLLPRPMSPYAASKLAAETYALAWQTSFELPVLALRFFNVYGPWQRADHEYAAIIPRVLTNIISREATPIYGDGEQTRDFTYVSNVCEVIGDAITRKVSSATPVNLAFGTSRTLNDVISIVEGVTGASVTTRRLPPRQSDVRHSSADPSRMRSLFPDVTPVDFETGISETYKWLRDHSMP